MSDWERPILVGCCPSSGSTLLSVILDSHPKIFSGPELAMFSHPFLWTEQGEPWRRRVLQYSLPTTDLFSLPDWSLSEGICPWIGFCEAPNLPWYGYTLDDMRALVPEWQDVRGLIEFLFRKRLQESGKSLWVEKSPTNTYGMQRFLELYPQGRGIVMLRDGRDVVCSLMKRGYGFARAASVWVLEGALTLALAKHPRVHLLRYEDLVADSRQTLTRLMDFLQLDACIDTLLNYQQSNRAKADKSISVESWSSSPQIAISSASIGRWRDTSCRRLHTFALEKVQIQPGFPGLEEMVGRNGRDILIAGGYQPSPTQDIDFHRFADWLLEERSTLLSLGDTKTFHFRYATPLRAAPEVEFRLLPCIAQMSKERSEHEDTIAQLRNELLLTQQQLERVSWQLQRRMGVRNGVKETLRSTWRMVRGRRAS